MANALGMHITHSTNELREVHMPNIFTHALVGLDFVEKIAALGQFHCDPTPDRILVRCEEGDYIRMARVATILATNVFMKGCFHLQLTGADFASSRGIFFVDELDGDDGSICVRGACFLDAAGDH